jgi:aarF domain-containing kinase
VRETLRTELGGDEALNEKFEFIDPIPLASASIAQVHVARLRGTGEEVVLKVLKPGVTETLKADLGFIYLASRLLETLAPDLARTSLGDIVADIRTSILEEVDFSKEQANLEEFRAFLAKADLTTVATCPRVYPELSTKKVLTMERLRGVSLIDLDGIRAYTDDPEGTLITALNTWSLSVVLCPSFHADVHSGNLLVLEDGRVGFIDFGIVGRLSPETWQAVTEVGEGLVGGDYRVMAQGLIRMGATAAAVDEGKLAGDLQALFERLRTLDPQVVVVADVESQTAAASLQVDEEQVTRLLLEIVDVASSNGLKLPRQFGLLIKQSLYFDRYTRILAPTLDPLRDARVNFPRTVEEAEEVALGGGGRMGARRRGREEDLGVVIDVTPKK